MSYVVSDSEDELTRLRTKTTLHQYTEFKSQPNGRVSAHTSAIAVGDALEPSSSTILAGEPSIDDTLLNEIGSDMREAEDNAGGIDDEGYRRDLLEIGEIISHQARPASVSLSRIKYIFPFISRSRSWPACHIIYVVTYSCTGNLACLHVN